MLFSDYRSWLPGCVAGLVGFAGLTLPVLAQEAAEASAGDAVALEEIVVTARKRAETLLEVPVAVTALTADDIDQKGIENLNDVALFTPGLTYFDSSGFDFGRSLGFAAGYLYPPRTWSLSVRYGF